MRKQKLEELKNYIEELKTIQVLEKRPLQIKDNILEKSFIKLEKITCLLGNGKVIEREEILKNNQTGSATIILPITTENKTLLVIQPRISTNTTVGVEFPAGYIEKGETPLQAGLRELEEETGYIPKNMHLLCSYYQDQGCSSAFNYSYLATGCERKKEQKLDASEFIRYFECDYDECLELANLGYINDANSLLALEKSKQFIKKRSR